MQLKSRAAAFLLSTAGCACSIAQMDRYIRDAFPPYDAYTTPSAYGITACSDDGAAIIGDGINLIRVKSSGTIAWEMRYVDPELEYGGQGHSVVELADRGFAIAAVPAFADPSLSDYRFGVLNVDANGVYRWGYVLQAQNQIDPVAYKQWDAARVRQLRDESIVVSGVNRYRAEHLCVPDTVEFLYDVGVLVKLDASGNPLFAYEYGETGFGKRSFVSFTDIAVGDAGIVAIGTIRRAGECETCRQDIDGLLVWMDDRGNVIQSWTFDSPFDPAPYPGGPCEQPTSDEWGTSIAMKGETVYFALAGEMAYSRPGEGFLARFDLGSGLVWSGRLKNFWPMYHGADITTGRRDPIFVGHQRTDMGIASALRIADSGSGTVYSSMFYDDPRSWADVLRTFRGVAPISEDRAWLVNGVQFVSPGDVYFMQVTGSGKSDCSWIPTDSELERELRVQEVGIEIINRLEFKEWRPKERKVNSESVDPCRE